MLYSNVSTPGRPVSEGDFDFNWFEVFHPFPCPRPEEQALSCGSNRNIQVREGAKERRSFESMMKKFYFYGLKRKESVSCLISALLEGTLKIIRGGKI